MCPLKYLRGVLKQKLLEMFLNFYFEFLVQYVIYSWTVVITELFVLLISTY